jgi:hypothetical protein
MKKRAALSTAMVLAMGLSVSSQANAEGFLDSLKEFFGLTETKAEAQAENKAEMEAEMMSEMTSEMAQQPTVAGLLSALTGNLNVSTEQAQGGLASLLNYAKNNVTADKFADLKQQMPGVETLMGSLPDISSMQSEGLGGLLDKASEYSGSIKAVNDLKKQFAAIGLEPQMIMSFVEQAQLYLDTEEGKQVKQTLMSAFSSLNV